MPGCALGDWLAFGTGLVLFGSALGGDYLLAWAFPNLCPTAWSSWLLMQAAMVAGFLTTYPVNWWLVARDIKEKI